MTLLGTTIGRFRVLSLLGQGGMGEVYVAHDETLDRRVALKSIVASRRLKPSAQARFLREARVLSRLDHPNICRIYDYVELAGHDFLVLELVVGRSLDAAIVAGLSRDLQLRVAEQIAAALAAAHAERIVHRDLKPNNVMLSEAGEVKVLDFGLAQSTGSRAAPPTLESATVSSSQPDLPVTERAFVGGGEAAAEGTWLDEADAEPPARLAPTPAAIPSPEVDAHTRQGAIMGTPGYLSPEQARGETATTASDMYAFGLLLQCLFTGRQPHPEGLDSSALVARALRAESLPPTGIPHVLAALVLRLKAAAPAARPTAVEVAARLRWIRDAPKRRWRRLAIAAVALAAVLGGVKYTLDLRTERGLAVAARQEAERRRGQAEDLIQFMLGDLRERLEPVGRLDALDGVAAKALDYFASIDAGQLTDADLFRRSQALTQIGEVRIAQGDLAAARRSFDEARDLAANVVAREPGNGEWLLGLGAIEFWLGNVHWLEGDLAAAEERFRAYLAAAERLVAIDAGNPEWRMELAYAHTNLGSVQNARGDLDAALAHFRLTVDVNREVVRAAPTDPRWQKELAVSLSWLAEVLFGRGELAEARAQYEASLEALERLATLAPDDTSYRFLLGIGHGKVGSVLESLGRLDEAIREDGLSLSVLSDLEARDPANADWRREAAVSRRRLGAAVTGTDPAAALRHLRIAATTLGELHAADPANTECRLDLARARLDLGRGLLADGKAAQATAEESAALGALAPVAAGADDRPRQLLEGEVRAALGQALSAAARRGEARATWTQAVAVLTPLATDARDPRVLAPLTQALLGLGRRAEAQPLIDRLRASGYRRWDFEEALR